MIESVVLSVSGLKCGGCEHNVTTQLSALDGVKSVKASSKEKNVSVEFDAEKINIDAIKAVIRVAGYSV